MVCFVDLFAGLGGFHLAARKLGAQCVFAAEIDSDLAGLYEDNFGIRPAGDINEVRPKDIPDHQLLCAGFPCQPFSKAGNQSGLSDKRRGGIFYKIIEILKIKQPTYVLLENVAHFVRHDEGNTYQTVCTALRKLGYDVQWAQFSPHEFGIPQIRERMYLVGKRGGLNGFKWPQKKTVSDELSVKAILDRHPGDAKPISRQMDLCLRAWQDFLDKIPADAKLPSFPIWAMEFGATYPYKHGTLTSRLPLNRLLHKRGIFGQSLRLSKREAILDRLPSHAKRDDGFPKWKQDFIRQNREFYECHRTVIDAWLPRIKAFPPSLQKLEWNCQGDHREIWKYVLQFRASGVRVKRPTTAPSLVAMTTTQVPIVGWEKRYMTIRELARLQSMDELQKLPSWTRAVSALGNAVNVTVARVVLESLLDF